MDWPRNVPDSARPTEPAPSLALPHGLRVAVLVPCYNEQIAIR
jgi:hypothetical protein